MLVRKLFDLRIVASVVVTLSYLCSPNIVLSQSAKPNANPLYSEYCMPCHGVTGAGNGELAYLLFPKPRDFTSGRFKLRSTPSGSRPTNNDLTNVILNGMPGTPMPSYLDMLAALSDSEVQQQQILWGPLQSDL